MHDIEILEALPELGNIPRAAVVEFIAKSLASEIVARFSHLIEVDINSNTRMTEYTLLLHVGTTKQLKAYVAECKEANHE